MSRTRFRLVLGNGAYGPGDVEPFLVEVARTIRGPNLPNWDHESLLAACEQPFAWRGEEVRYVVVSPRYSQDSLTSIFLRGGMVALGRVHPGHDPMQWTHLDQAAVHYWAIASAEVVNANAQAGPK